MTLDRWPESVNMCFYKTREVAEDDIHAAFLTSSHVETQAWQTQAGFSTVANLAHEVWRVPGGLATG